MEKQVFLDLTNCKGLGDALCATPTIRKIYNSYNTKVNVTSHYPELFKNNPYVNKNYPNNALDIEFIKQNHTVHNSFYGIGKTNENGVEYKHNNIDIRQFHAIMLGFMLGKDEMECDYVADEFQEIEELPEKFVLIHPVQNWPSRTWSVHNWKKLTDMLNEKNISVVSVGKDSSETGFFSVDKPTFNFVIEKGLNLMNKTSISQVWHLINKSICFVTMDSGLLHLAGTTDTDIIHLGSSIKPEFRIPYRNNSQTYKHHYVSGGCDLCCASDMKYGVKEWGSIMGVPPLIGCLENKKEFECHPSVDKVFDKIISLL